jgi:anti-sigma factor RsiW
MPPSSGVGHDGGFLPMGVPCCHDLDATMRDRFELLSAYLDGEVTSEERQQVLCWLQHDENSRCLYNRLLALRQGMRSQDCPPTSDAEAKVVGGLHNFNHRLKLATMAGAGVAAIGVIHLLSGVTGAGYTPWRMAMVPQPEALNVTLDRPAFPIPQTATFPMDASSSVIERGMPLGSEL